MSSEAGFFADAHARPRLSAVQRVQEVLRMRKSRRIYAAYRSMFMGEDGKLTRNGAIVLADLTEAARLGEMGSGLSDAELRDIFGRRTIVLHLINRLDRDGTKCDQLTQAIRELGNE